MNWFNFYCASLRTSIFAERTREQIGQWFMFVNYCCQHENGGTIKGCKDWPDRRWLLTVGDTPEGNPELLHFDTFGNLHVQEYPIQMELQTQAKRRAADRTNETRWGPKSQSNGSHNPESKNRSASRSAKRSPSR